MSPSVSRPPLWQFLLAYAAIYLIWGSSFLGIRWSVETIPPTLAMGVRSVVGGLGMLVFGRAVGGRWPTRGELAAALGVGLVLFAGNNGLLAEAQRRVPSGIAALIVATIPLFVPMVVWAAGGGRPSLRAASGLALGLGGVALLVFGRGGGGAVAPIDAGMIMLAAFLWAIGTVLSTRVPRSPSLAINAGLQLLGGGSALVLYAVATGQVAPELVHAVSTKSALSVVYLTLTGTVLGFGAYAWLLRYEPPTRVATYAFVNPVVAVIIGWGVEGEPITALLLAAMCVIVAAVVLIVLEKRRPAR